jgi:lysophospholipase L1-like esterase
MKRFAVVCFLLAASVYAQTGPHWVATWATPQPLIRMPPPPPRPASQQQPGRGPNPVQQAINAHGFANQTVRMIVHTSIGGSKLRLKFSNSFGGTPVVLHNVHVALRAKDSEIVPASDRAATFNGKPDVTLGPGMVIVSDPVDLEVPSRGDLAISLYFPTESGPPSSHGGLHTTYIKEGDQTSAAAFEDPVSTGNYYWLETVDVLAPASSSLVVALGDSITEGFRSTPNNNSTWPDVLSQRLAANKATAGIGVANMGIGGNRILRDGTGASALARFDHDVLEQSGVKWIVMLESINDIGHANTEPASAEDLIGGFKQIIERAHTHGIKVMGCTLPPYEGASYYREEGEAIREAVNDWIRTGKAFDAVADFEAATRDAADPKKLKAEFDPGDHLHLNDAGYKAMADSINLSLLK